MVQIIRGTTKKPISSQRLADFFVAHNQYEGFLYIGYPIIGTSEGPYPIDALLVLRFCKVSFTATLREKHLSPACDITTEKSSS
jgi:hypothetical protein